MSSPRVLSTLPRHSSSRPTGVTRTLSLGWRTPTTSTSPPFSHLVTQMLTVLPRSPALCSASTSPLHRCSPPSSASPNSLSPLSSLLPAPSVSSRLWTLSTPRTCSRTCGEGTSSRSRSPSPDTRTESSEQETGRPSGRTSRRTAGSPGTSSFSGGMRATVQEG